MKVRLKKSIMDIELSEDLQHYKESVVLGLTFKQAFFSLLSLGTGTAIVLLLYQKIGITLSCYVATPVVVPLALTGFYSYHGMTFWQFASKLFYYSFFNRPLVYSSTESVEEVKKLFIEVSQEQKIQEEKVVKEEKAERKEDMHMVKKKAIRILGVTVGLIAVGAVTAVWFKYYR